MYKDPEKQKKAVREATRRYRARLKGITSTVIPCDTPDVIPKITRQVNPYKDMANHPYCEEVKPQSDNPMKVGYIPPRS